MFSEIDFKNLKPSKMKVDQEEENGGTAITSLRLGQR
jgi:hypothetical protein